MYDGTDKVIAQAKENSVEGGREVEIEIEYSEKEATDRRKRQAEQAEQVSDLCRKSGQYSGTRVSLRGAKLCKI